MIKKDTFLIEIGTEELPAKMLTLLSEMFAARLKQQIEKENLNFGEVKTFVTPRRLAVLMKDVDAVQPDTVAERKGPALSVAMDENNNPTPAGLGFARSCGVNFNQLEIKSTEDGGWLVHRLNQKGKHFTELASSIVQEVLRGLSVGRTMRWNESDVEFLRPVHWIVLMYGEQAINAEVLGLTAGKTTWGHRFHHPEAMTLTHADQYEAILENTGKVIPDFKKRKTFILQQIESICDEQNAQPVFNQALLDEVTGLVEWPVPYLATYPKDFLVLPKEVLVSAIEQHQKCFPVENKKGELNPCFIAIANLESLDPQQIVVGNERVMRARLADAAFFFYTDKKFSLESRLETLKNVTFQAKLGTLFDKALRLSELSAWMMSQSEVEPFSIEEARRAGLLAKTDLVTDMVHEFPELQGVMGYHYALHDQETPGVATAIYEHYLPRISGDQLPNRLSSCTLAIADRIDTIVGIFSLGQAPSGDKDPFALKRAAIGVLRILIERELSISLDDLVRKSIECYGDLIQKKDFVPQVKAFVIERLRAWYSEKGIPVDTLNAVLASQNKEPLDMHHRVIAVERFRQLPEAQTLTSANKRISNILQQANFDLMHDLTEPDPHLFETDAEKNLYHQMKQLREVDNKNKADYADRLRQFAQLHTAVDHFFDRVMVMVPDEYKRNNRLQLLGYLRSLFLEIADISILQL